MFFVSLLFFALVGISNPSAFEAEGGYSQDLPRYEKEVRLACETIPSQSSSGARQALARSTLDRIQLRLGELKNKTEELTKNLEEEKTERIEAELQAARQNQAIEMKRYRLEVSGETLGRRSPASIEDQLKRVRDADNKVQQLEARLKQKKGVPTLSLQGTQSDKTYQDLETLIKISDKYQDLHTKLTNCAFSHSPESKSLEEKIGELKQLKVLKETNELKEPKDPDGDYRQGSR